MEFPLPNQDKRVIEQAVFDVLQALIFKGGLPIFTAIPTYQGTAGEIVLVVTGVSGSEVYALYAYLKNNANPQVWGWRHIQ